MTLDELIAALEEKRGYNNVNGHHEITSGEVDSIIREHERITYKAHEAIKQEMVSRKRRNKA